MDFRSLDFGVLKPCFSLCRRKAQACLAQSKWTIWGRSYRMAVAGGTGQLEREARTAVWTRF
jgi:hypothetical protein